MLVQSMLASNVVYTFGFGSNMNIENVKKRKGLHVLDHCCASLPGWRLAFTLGGIDLVEPAFADAQRGDRSDEIHGVALGLSAEDIAKLDEQEYVHDPNRGYFKEAVEVTSYDGRKIDAFVYTSKKPLPEKPCSQRYLKILVDGARDAGLNPQYLDKLAALPTYSPSDQTIRKRESLPNLYELPRMTVAELAATKAEGADSPFVFLAVMGYVVKVARAKLLFNSHLERDITTRMTRQWRGLPLDINDDLGQPPFCLPRGHVLLRDPNHLGGEEEYCEGENGQAGVMSRDEHAFVLQWLDHYMSKAEGVVAYVSEFREEWEAARSAAAPTAEN